MNALDRLAARLADHPDLQWLRSGDRIRIEAPSHEGFAIEFHFSGDEWTVYAGEGGWHWHFLEETEALDFVAWCYSGKARLREVRRGSTVVKSVLEARVDEEWNMVGEVGCVLPKIWSKRTEVVLANPNLLAKHPTQREH